MEKPKNFDKMLACLKQSYHSEIQIIYTAYLGRYDVDGDPYHNILTITVGKKGTPTIMIERLEYNQYDKEWDNVDSLKLAIDDLKELQNLEKINFKTLEVLYGKK